MKTGRADDMLTETARRAIAKIWWQKAPRKPSQKAPPGDCPHGTGFLVAPGVLLTARHVVADPNQTDEELRTSSIQAAAQFIDVEDWSTLTLLASSQRDDWALLRVENPPGGIPPLACDVMELEPGVIFHSFGYPEGVPLGCQYYGAVSTQSWERSCQLEWFQPKREFEAASAPAEADQKTYIAGMSGAPVLVNGRIVGLITKALLSKQADVEHAARRNTTQTLWATPIAAVVQIAKDHFPEVAALACLGPFGGKLPDKPFVGIQSFDAEHAGVFFGRAQETLELLKWTNNSSAPVLVLQGRSGVGKSSLLQAGLIPRLGNGWQVSLLRRAPGSGMPAQIRQAIQQPLAPGIRGLIVLDQVEECFIQPRSTPKTLAADRGRSESDSSNLYDPNSSKNEELQELIDVLYELPLSCQWKIILSTRVEWFSFIRQAFEDRQGKEWVPQDLLLEGLSERGEREVILGLTRWSNTKRQYGLRVDASLVSLLSNTLRGKGEVPTAVALQIVLTWMWEQVEHKNDDAREFNEDLFQRVWTDELPPLTTYFRRMEEKVRAYYPALVDSGLLLDILKFHTTDQFTALRRSQDELLERYAHVRDGLKSLIKILLLPEVRLLVNVTGSDTYLVHDLLAPIVRSHYHASFRPGQSARRILDGHLPGQPTKALLSEDACKRIEAGRPGMQKLTADEERLLEDSLTHNVRRRWALRGALPVLALLALVAGYFRYNSFREAAARLHQQELARLRVLADADPTTAALVLRETPEQRDDDDWRLLGMKVLQQPLAHDLWTFPDARPLALTEDGRNAILLSDAKQLQLWNREHGLLARTDLPINKQNVEARLFIRRGGPSLKSNSRASGEKTEQPRDASHAVVKADRQLYYWGLQGKLEALDAVDVDGFSASDSGLLAAWKRPASTNQNPSPGSQQPAPTSELFLLNVTTKAPLQHRLLPGDILGAEFDASGKWLLVLLRTREGNQLRLLPAHGAAPLSGDAILPDQGEKVAAIAAHPTQAGQFLTLSVPETISEKHSTQADDGSAGDAKAADRQTAAKAATPAVETARARFIHDTILRILTLDENGAYKHSNILAFGRYPRDLLAVSPDLKHVMLMDARGTEAVVLPAASFTSSLDRLSDVMMSPSLSRPRYALKEISLHDPDAPISAALFLSSGQVATLAGRTIRYWRTRQRLIENRRDHLLTVFSSMLPDDGEYVECGPDMAKDLDGSPAGTETKRFGFVSCIRSRIGTNDAHRVKVNLPDLMQLFKPGEFVAFRGQVCAKSQRAYFFGTQAILEIDLKKQTERDVWTTGRRIDSELPIRHVTCDLAYANSYRPGAGEKSAALLKLTSQVDPKDGKEKPSFRAVPKEQDSISRGSLCGDSSNWIGSDLGGSPAAGLVVCNDRLFQFVPPDSTIPIPILYSAAAGQSSLINGGFNEQQTHRFTFLGNRTSDPTGELPDLIRPRSIQIVDSQHRQPDDILFRIWPPLSSDQLDISRDGRWFAVIQGEHIRLALLSDPSRHVDLEIANGLNQKVQFSPNGEWLMASSMSGPLKGWPLTPKRIRCALWELATCLSPDERRFFYRESPATAAAAAQSQRCAQKQKEQLDRCR